MGKNLNELIEEFKKNARVRTEKINKNIEELERQAGELEEKLKVSTAKLVDCELAGDEPGMEKYSDETKKHQEELALVKAKIEAYEAELERTGQGDVELLEKIRQQAKAERIARMAKQKELAEQKRKVEEEIQELEVKKGELEKEINRLSRDAEVDAVLSNIGNLLCPHFVPGTKRVMSYDEQKREIKKWIES